MKQFLSKVALVGALIVLGVQTTAWAGYGVGGGVIAADTEPMNTITCTQAQSNASSCNNVLGAGRTVIGFKLIAGTSSSSAVGLYDATTLPAGSSTTGMFDEIYESTTVGTTLQMYSKPYKLTTGLSIAVTGAGSIGVVYYR